MTCTTPCAFCSFTANLIGLIARELRSLTHAFPPPLPSSLVSAGDVEVSDSPGISDDTAGPSNVCCFPPPAFPSHGYWMARLTS